MSIEEIIKELEHTIEYFEGCTDKFQRGRKCQAMVTLEQLRQYNVSGQSEQFYCTCSRAKGFDNDEDGMPYCIECQKPVK